MSMHDEINQAIRAAVASSPGLAMLSVNWVANAALKTYQTGNEEAHVLYASLEHFKQQTRKILSAKFSPDGEENEAHQNDMFSGTLQERYPIPRRGDSEPVYKLREHMTLAEIDWNISQLEKSADARKRHAHALRAFREERARGRLKKAA